ncbi:MAG: hypothetical protein GXP45_07655 [bacterium]|nr:hypothetical protein [bacterium]
MIRGEFRGNKKELYIKEVKLFFAQNISKILKNFVEHFDRVLERHYVQIYLSNASTGMNHFLKENNLMNVFDTGHIYAWDTNNSFDKVDGFVTKRITIDDSYGATLIDTENDIVDISSLEPGNYSMTIWYRLDVPKQYYTFIHSLEQKYNIQLKDRERGILAMQAAQYAPQYPKKWRETKATVYFPLQIDLLDTK